jgi:hypothetical protein
MKAPINEDVKSFSAEELSCAVRLLKSPDLEPFWQRIRLMVRNQNKGIEACKKDPHHENLTKLLASIMVIDALDEVKTIPDALEKKAKQK